MARVTDGVKVAERREILYFINGLKGLATGGGSASGNYRRLLRMGGRIRESPVAKINVTAAFQRRAGKEALDETVALDLDGVQNFLFGIFLQ